MANIVRLKNICKRLETNDEKKIINKNFYAVNMHGYELNDDYVIPSNIRIIMFCYTGKILNICPRFDKFNWENILTDLNATYNYCTFLATLGNYSTLRNHFCVYEEGHTIKDMMFKSDPYFRNGIFKLPVHASIMDYNNNIIYTTSKKSMENIKEHPEYLDSDDDTDIVIDKSIASSLLKDHNNQAHIISKYTIPLYKTLKSLVEQIKFKDGGGTIILLTCRESKQRNKLLHAKRVIEEIEKMYNNYLQSAKEIGI